MCMEDHPNLAHIKDRWASQRKWLSPSVDTIPVLSKVFEQLVLKQVIAYIDELCLLAPNISGFRKGYSTTTVLLGIRDDLIRAMKRGEVTMMVCTADYSKAFDTVQFKAVLTKMHGMGFLHTFLQWKVNYLTDRKQFVQIGDKSSETATIKFGIPQGSILGSCSSLAWLQRTSLVQQHPIRARGQNKITWSADGRTPILGRARKLAAILLLRCFVHTQKLKKMAPYHICKQLVEYLVLSKLDYAAAVFYRLPVYQLKPLQRVQNACTGFILGRHANENDIHTLNWLPMSKERDFIVLKLVYKALHDKNWPSYLALEKREVGKYNLRSMGVPRNFSSAV